MEHWQQPKKSAGLAFGARDADADDYYNFLPSDDDGELSDDDAGVSPAVATSVSQHADIATMESVPLAAQRPSGGIAVATNSSAVLTQIGTLGAVGTTTSDSADGDLNRQLQQRPTQDTLALVVSGAVILSGGKQLRVSPESLAKHVSRKSQLESALDALSVTRGGGSDSGGAGGDNSIATPPVGGEAPFRFRAATTATTSADVEMADASEQSNRGKPHGEQTSNSVLKKAMAKDGNSADVTGDVDPLYDDSMDDADEKWVQRNFRGGQSNVETDATLCCPCCFMTVCMDCQRHVTYTNQYRSSVAVNCRIKKDEILTYASGAASASSLPFQKRLNMAATRTNAHGEGFSRLLTANEFYPVACSDCGTTVGVYDRHQQYHFFNVLPSNC